jgi:hypothetical protein
MATGATAILLGLVTMAVVTGLLTSLIWLLSRTPHDTR